MTINLPIIFDGKCRLGFLEMVFQDIKISKFFGETCLQTHLVNSRFSEVLRLDSLLPIWGGRSLLDEENRLRLARVK